MNKKRLAVATVIFILFLFLLFKEIRQYYCIKKSIVCIAIPFFLFLLIIITLELWINIKQRLENESILRDTLEELQRSEERYRTLVELCPDAIYVAVNGRNIFSNKAGAKLMGAEDPKELEGCDLRALVNAKSYDNLGQIISGTYENAENKGTVDLEVLRLDGSYVDVEAASAIFSYDGEPALMCVVRDISERKRSEELKKKIEENMQLLSEAIEYDKLKMEFFANISHEFKTPLNIILGSLQLIEYISHESDAGDEEYKLCKYTQIMKQNCFRLLRLLNNFIDVAEIDSGFLELHLQNHNLAEIVKEITNSVANFVKDKGIIIEYECYINNLVTACDVDKIERIVLNLLSNAAKFSKPEGSIRVSLYKENGEACISIKDSGIGIPEDKREIIFERFHQVDKSFSRSCEGSGIGLSLVKSLVAMHGGTIGVISKQGEGSEFIVRLPINTAVDEEWIAVMEETAVSREEKIKIEFSDIYF